MTKPIILNDNTNWGEEADKLITLTQGIVNPIHNGKKALWLGTSIPQGCTYPINSCAELGIELTKQTLASSACRNMNSNDTYTGMSWRHYVYGLSQTAAEKETIIANWDTIKGDLTGTPPDTLSEVEQAVIRSSTYENKIVPYLADHDLFILDHGYNDYIGGEDLANYKAIPESYKNRNYFLGAMNFIIDLIFTANYKAKIVIIGHYENTGNTHIAEAQRTLANYWQIPMLNTYEYTRWSDKIINGKTMLLNWVTDGVHPYTDVSGDADLLLDRVVTNFLRTIV